MEDNKRQKIGLALGSGGAKGLAHIGVIKVLEENNIPIDYIAGSSVGALIGAFYAAHKDSAAMEKIALSTNWKMSFYLLDPGSPNGLIKGKKVENLIKNWLSDTTFSELKIPLTIVATDLITAEQVNLTTGDLIKAIRASLSVPPIFEAVKYENYLLTDGGLSNPVPVDTVKNMGADIVIAVNLDSNKFSEDNNSNFSAKQRVYWPKISIRALNILRYHLAKNTTKLADTMIEPEVEEIGLLGWNKFFDTNEVKKIIRAGQEATKIMLPQIKKMINQ
ncbi:MAG: patatin-like phospholipase family protein [Patescibacteria group bacterium]